MIRVYFVSNIGRRMISLACPELSLIELYADLNQRESHPFSFWDEAFFSVSGMCECMLVCSVSWETMEGLEFLSSARADDPSSTEHVWLQVKPSSNLPMLGARTGADEGCVIDGSLSNFSEARSCVEDSLVRKSVCKSWVIALPVSDGAITVRLL